MLRLKARNAITHDAPNTACVVPSTFYPVDWEKMRDWDSHYLAISRPTSISASNFLIPPKFSLQSPIECTNASAPHQHRECLSDSSNFTGVCGAKSHFLDC